MLRRAIQRVLRRLHRDSGGQSMAFVALTGFLICAFVILMLNNGRNLTHKVRCQNAVDASAVSAATWQARGMNLIAMTNIMQSMLLAEAVFIAAIPWAVAEAGSVASAGCACYCFIFCDPDPGRCVQSCKEAWNTNFIADIYIFIEVFDLMDFVFERMGQLSEVAATIQEGFQAMAMTDGSTIGQNNGLDYAFVWPNEMPLQVGDYHDLCDTTANGSAGGYDAWWNPVITGAMLMFAITSHHAEAYGPALAAYPHWAQGPLGSPTQSMPFHALMGKMAPMSQGNAFFSMSVDAVYGVECVAGASTFNLYTDTGQSEPLLLADDFDGSAKYVAVGYDSTEQGQAVLLSSHFQNSYNEVFGTIVVAQAEVVNVEQASMFTPRWHARLSPVSELGEMPMVITSYLYSTDGIPWPDATAAAKISLFVATLSDLTQTMITH